MYWKFISIKLKRKFCIFIELMSTYILFWRRITEYSINVRIQYSILEIWKAMYFSHSWWPIFKYFNELSVSFLFYLCFHVDVKVYISINRYGRFSINVEAHIQNSVWMSIVWNPCSLSFFMHEYKIKRHSYFKKCKKKKKHEYIIMYSLYTQSFAVEDFCGQKARRRLGIGFLKDVRNILFDRAVVSTTSNHALLKQYIILYRQVGAPILILLRTLIGPYGAVQRTYIAFSPFGRCCAEPSYGCGHNSELLQTAAENANAASDKNVEREPRSAAARAEEGAKGSFSILPFLPLAVVVTGVQLNQNWPIDLGSSCTTLIRWSLNFQKWRFFRKYVAPMQNGKY